MRPISTYDKQNITKEWLNDIQEEISTTIESEKILLDSSITNQLEQAIKNKLKRRNDLIDLSIKFKNNKKEILSIIDSNYQNISVKNEALKKLVENIVDQNLIQNVNSIRKDAESSVKKIENESLAIVNKFKNGLLEDIIEDQNKLKSDKIIEFKKNISQDLEYLLNKPFKFSFDLSGFDSRNHRSRNGDYFELELEEIEELVRPNCPDYLVFSSLAEFADIDAEVTTDFIVDTSELENDSGVSIYSTLRTGSKYINNFLYGKVEKGEKKFTRKSNEHFNKRERPYLKFAIQTKENTPNSLWGNKQKITIKTINLNIKINKINLLEG